MPQAAIAAKFSDLLTADKLAKVVTVCSNLGINPNWLLAVMYFETAQTFSPSKTNSIGSVGLIQFTRDKKGVEYKTIAGKRYSLADLAKMTFAQQMDVVEKYYKEAAGGRKLTSFIDTYLVTFFPAALGQSDSFVLATKNLSASLIAAQNPIFDREKDGIIHKGEVTDYFRDLYTKWGFDFDEDINVSTGVKGAFITVIVGVLVFFYTVGTVLLPLNQNEKINNVSYADITINN